MFNQSAELWTEFRTDFVKTFKKIIFILFTKIKSFLTCLIFLKYNTPKMTDVQLFSEEDSNGTCGALVVVTSHHDGIFVYGQC